MKPVDASKPPSMIPTWQDKWLLTTLPSGALKTTSRSLETLWGTLKTLWVLELWKRIPMEKRPIGGYTTRSRARTEMRCPDLESLFILSILLFGHTSKQEGGFLFVFIYSYYIFIYLLLRFYLFVFIYFYTHECLPVCVPIHHVHPGASWGQKRLSDPLALDLQRVAS